MISFKIRKNRNTLDDRIFIFTKLTGYFEFTFGKTNRITVQVKRFF